MRMTFICAISAFFFWPLNQAIAVTTDVYLLASSTADYVRLAIACNEDWHPTFDKTYTIISSKGDNASDFAKLVKLLSSGKNRCDRENFEFFQHHQKFMLDDYQTEQR